jgi:Lar family restriction alleviation protein
MNELKPCPFCGGTPILELFNDGFFDYVRIRCCRVMFDWCGDETGEQAIAAWNRRAGNDTNVATDADYTRNMRKGGIAWG